MVDNNDIVKEVREYAKLNGYENTRIPLFIFAKYIREILLIDVQKAEQIYYYIAAHYPKGADEEPLRYLKAIILERKQYCKLSLEQQENYHMLQKRGKEEYQNSNLKKSCAYYQAGLSEMKQNIFNYYFGKMLYKLEHFYQAKKYLERYITQGGEKCAKASLYLFYIYKKLKKEKKSLECLKRIIKFNALFQEDFEFKCNNYTFKTGEDNCIGQEDIMIETNVTSFSHEYVQEQLSKIKNLLLIRQYKQAEKLLKKLDQEQRDMTLEDRKQVEQFHRDKRLYHAK